MKALQADGVAQEKRTAFEFVRMERTEAIERVNIHLFVNGAAVAVGVAGESCFGYSINIAMLIASAYAHLQ